MNASPSAFWEKKSSDRWAEYWDSLHEPHRDAIIEALRALPRFSSLLEVGCGPGVNLWRVLEAFPDADLTGLDVSQAAIDNGYARFAEADQTRQGRGRVALAVGPLPEALEPMQPVDVVLSCYTLAYIAPQRLAETFFGLLTLARQAVILAEPMVTPQEPAAKLTNLPEWRHDYLEGFAHAPGWAITSMKPLYIDRMNRILVAERTARLWRSS